jgi:Flp pilus assembly protein TadG
VSRVRGRHATQGRRRQRGQTLVEFAVMIPLFALLLFGLLDFGRVIFTQNALTEAAREASRVASLSPSESSTKYAAIRSAARNAAPGVALADANITGSGCTDCFYPGGAVSGGIVVVTIETTVTLSTPLLAQILGGSFDVSSTSRSVIP